MEQKKGMVYLVGAGPGDPGLVTLRAVECIRRADVVVYDFLADASMLAHASPDAEVIYVGKKGGDHTMTQDKINALLVEKALAGNIVTRLKGGDPFIFGRGGEEADELFDAGVAFEVVPGVTSAVAAPAYAGIPVTHRDHTSTVAFITGHEDPNKTESSIAWDKISTGVGTLVFLMGVKNLPMICQKLIKNGRDPETPAALVRWGTKPVQRTVTGTLSTIVDVVREAGIKPPAVFVVGGVVTCREKLNWFEKRPLFGKTILVTRARKQASAFRQSLMELGARCVETPTIQIAPPDDWFPMDEAVENLPEFDWVVFTSVNGVEIFFDRLFKAKKDARALGGLKVGAIGPVTAEKLLEYGIQTDLLPETYRAESVVEAFSAFDMNGKKVLLPRAKGARTILPEELDKMGAEILDIYAYQTLADLSAKEELLALLKNREVDMVTFTSSSTASNFAALFQGKEEMEEAMQGVAVASIGPITSDTAKGLGLSVDVEAAEFTIPGLTEAIVKYFSRE